MKNLLLLFCLLCAATTVTAAGPKVMATLDRTALNEAPLSSPAAYNQASRTEILAFAQALLQSEALSNEQLKQRLGVKQLNALSVERVRQRYWQRLLANYGHASKDCPHCEKIDSLNALRSQAAQAVIAELRIRFHQYYLYELLRLAALFPATSSEIDTFSAAEVTGAQFDDGQFLLTFDDGPTAANGNTDKLLADLRQQNLQALFFVLGENLQKRQQQHSAEEIAALYRGQCVGMHGWQHQSHSRWERWQNSVLDTAKLIQQTAPQSYVPLFRPPYGQRRADSGPFFQQHGLRVVLWDIDSQDWSRQLSAQQVADRVLTLMLLWRQGIVLFHDVHSKAPTALNQLRPIADSGGFRWLDCHTFNAALSH